MPAEAPQLHTARVKFVPPGSEKLVDAIAVGPAARIKPVRVEPSGMGFSATSIELGFATGRSGNRDRVIPALNRDLQRRGRRELVSDSSLPGDQDAHEIFTDDGARLVAGSLTSDGLEVILFQGEEERGRTVLAGERGDSPDHVSNASRRVIVTTAEGGIRQYSLASTEIPQSETL